MVRVTINRSRCLGVVLVAVHIAAIALVVPLHILPSAKALLGVVIFASLAHALWRHALLKARAAIVAIVLEDRETVSVQTRDGAWRNAALLGTSYVSPLLTALNLRVEGLRLARHVVIVPDNIENEDFRCLRVVLRWGYRKT